MIKLGRKIYNPDIIYKKGVTVDIRFLDNGYTKHVKDLVMYCFNFKDPDAQEFMTTITRMENVIGAFDENKLMASLEIRPYDIYYEKKQLRMGGIGGVSSYPEYRHGGVVRDLLTFSLRHMYENGYMWSFLGPFSFDFYRKYGWEIAFDKKRYEFDIRLLECFSVKEQKYVRLDHNDHVRMIALHNKLKKEENGVIIRKLDDIKRRVKDCYIYGIENENNLAGYIAYQIKDGVFKVLELCCEDIAIKKQLLGFIARHSAQAKTFSWLAPVNDDLALIIKEPKRQAELNHAMMARAVNVKAVLGAYDYGMSNGHFIIKIIDPQVIDNNSTFIVDINDEGAIVKEASFNDPDIICQVNVFSQMAIGYAGFVRQYNAGRIEVQNPKAVELLSCVFKDKTTSVYDYF